MRTLSGYLIAAGALVAGTMVVTTSPVQALTLQECSARYGTAKAAGTLGSQTWNEFRKSQCGAEDTAVKPAEAPVQVAQQVAQAKSEAKPEAKSESKPAKSARKEKKEDAKPSGPAVFPTAISPKYAKEKEARQRMKTCLDQYNANKAANANGGLKWIQKGGGYYSECNKKLKA